MVRVQIAAPQEHTPGQGQAIAQLAGLQVVEIERGSPLYQRVQGLIVSAVERDSQAWHYGFRPGDIVYAINNKRIRTLAEFQAALRSAPRGYAVSLLRGDFSVTIVIR
jgi:serine protease Do/serine protease DegQ